MLVETLAMNAAFFVIASLYVWIGARRAAGTAAFPGPRPVGPAFKAWLIVIWLVGLAAPIAALVFDGLVRGLAPATLALGAYLVMVFAQVGTEIFVWKKWRSPIWVIVPCLYLTWRLFQVYWGFQLIEGVDAPVTFATLAALGVLWVINIGVHFTNIPMTLRWDHHPKDAVFPALHKPVPFGEGAQDALDRTAAGKP